MEMHSTRARLFNPVILTESERPEGARASGRTPMHCPVRCRIKAFLKQTVDRRLGPNQARFWLDWVEKPSPAH